MFTGIIETLGHIEQVIVEGENHTFWVRSDISSTLKVDQSVSHNGVCLTVEEIKNDAHRVTAIAETLRVTDAGEWVKGTLLNLEQCLPFNGRLDGHLVQGHVDSTAVCLTRIEKNGSWEYSFGFDPHYAPLIIEKGSICINGISLTAFGVTEKSFTVAIIPYTYAHTNMQNIYEDARVNLEFDVIGKYILRSRSLTEHLNRL